MKYLRKMIQQFIDAKDNELLKEDYRVKSQM